MELDFYSKKHKFKKFKHIFNYYFHKTISSLKLSFKPIVSVSLINNEDIHQINKKYRNIDRPTDVISFAFIDAEPDRKSILQSGKEYCLGDVYISYEKAIEQSKLYGHSLKREMCFLFVHGLLHLIGYDHQNEEQEKEMFGWQNKILGDLK